MAVTSPPEGLNRPLALLVAATFFMENLDGTIIATAAPTMARDFHVEPVALNIAMTAYLLAVAVGIQASGWVAERFGARRIFVTAIVIFTIASGLCALSDSLPVLIGARVLQGLGGAMMVPIGRLVVLRSTPKAQLIAAIAYLTWPGLAAPVIAPSVGGVITTYLGWHWIFLINLPLGVLALIAALRLVPDVPARRVPGLDWVGFIFLAGAVISLVIGLEGEWWILPATVIFLGLVIWWMRRRTHPLINFSVLRIQTFRQTVTGGGIYTMLINAVPFLLPLMFQVGYGWSPVQAGLLVMAVFIGNIGIKPATTPILRALGIRNTLLVSILGSALVFLGCAFLTPQTPIALIFVILVLSGVFRSVGFTAYNTVRFADVSDDDLPASNTFSAMVQTLAAGLGVAFGALAVRLTTQVLQSTGHPLHGEDPYRWAFVILAVLMLIPLAESYTLARHAGAEVTGRR